MSDDFCTAVLHDHVYPTQAGSPGLVVSGFMPSWEFAGSEKRRYNCQS
jgi:hypothetical protein